MNAGIAKVGIYVMIIGDHNDHCFKTGEIVRIINEAHVPIRVNNYGYCWCCTNGRHSSNVREVDMRLISAKVV